MLCKSLHNKGKIEKFHQVVDDFIAEVKLQKPSDINELNRYWQIYLNEYYHKWPHAGISEYYQSQGISVPPEGITPEQEFNRDTRSLRHYDINTITKAFTHCETRLVDEGGRVKIMGGSYDAGPQYIRHRVKVMFDPLNMDTIEIIPEDNAKPYTAAKMEISAWCKRGEPIKKMERVEADHSRMLDVLEKGYRQSVRKVQNAISYSEME